MNLRTAARDLGRDERSIAVMLDTKGPEIRTGFLEDGKAVTLEAKSLVEITTDYSFKGNSKKIACSYASLPTSVEVVSTIPAADGSLVMKVVELRELSIAGGDAKHRHAVGAKEHEPARRHRRPLQHHIQGPRRPRSTPACTASILLLPRSFAAASDVELIREVLGEGVAQSRSSPRSRTRRVSTTSTRISGRDGQGRSLAATWGWRSP